MREAPGEAASGGVEERSSEVRLRPIMASEGWWERKADEVQSEAELNVDAGSKGARPGKVHGVEAGSGEIEKRMGAGAERGVTARGDGGGGGGEGTRGGERGSRRRDMARVRVDGMCYSMMVGTGETYLALFALAVGMPEVTAGLIASVPMLAGAFLQLISPGMVRVMGSAKRWVMTCVAVQAMSFLPLIVGAVKGYMPGWMVFAAAGMYWGSGMAAGATWSAWVGGIVPRRVRAKFFASRTQWMHCAVLVGIVGAGEFLEATKGWESAALPFAFTFGVACMCRCVSAWILKGTGNRRVEREEHKHIPLGRWVMRLRGRPDGRLLGLMLVMQLAIWVSGPFFAPYMKEQLRLDYRMIEVLLAISYVARVAALRWLGRMIQRVGERVVLRVTGLAVVPLGSLWMVSDGFLWLVVIQVLAGGLWAAYELSTFLLQLETIAEEERASVLTTYNIGSAVAMVSGAMLGGWLLKHFGSDHTAYMVVFGVTGVMRLCCYPLVLRAAKVRTQRGYTAEELRMGMQVNAVAVRLNRGVIEDRHEG